MIDTRKIAEEYRLSHWAKIMQERKTSGLSIKTYCREIGICVNTYFYWQRKLRGAACQELVPVTTEQQSEVAAPNGWAICKTEEPEPVGKTLIIEIDGFRIIAEPETDPEHLGKVCRVLKSLC